MMVKEVFVPGLRHTVRFQDRHEMRRGHPVRRLRLPCGQHGPMLPQPTLPIDWARNLSFPMDANDQYGDCHSADSEVLTEQGWVKWPDYDGHSLLGTMNPMTGLLEFQAPTALRRREHDGPMAFAEHKRLDFAVTPNHRMYHRPYHVPKPYVSGSAHYGDFRFDAISNLPTRCLIPGTTTGFIGTELKTIGIDGQEWDGTDFLRLLAIIISCGYVSGADVNRGLVSFCCFRDSRVELIHALAHRTGFREQTSRPGVWYRYDMPLANWLRANAYTDTEYRTPYKRVPDLVKVASQQQIEEFLQFFGDQHINSAGVRSFYSSSPRLIDDLQELLLRTGSRGTICNNGIRPGGMSSTGTEIRANYPSFTLYENRESDIVLQRLKRCPTIEYDHYKGEVFCATVPNSTLVTRRNGKILISGNCMYAAACHADNTWTGNVGAESFFDPATIIADYLKLAGGDNGLDEGTLLTGWKAGLAGVPAANMLDAVDLDPTNAALMQLCVQKLFLVIFMFDVPDAWIQSFQPGGGTVWDAPATADRNNGHGILVNGYDTVGRARMQTWGSYVWVTPGGISVCDPSAFAVFSLRMFNAAGVAPDGETYDQKSALWTQLGGHALPPNPFPAPGPGPTPVPIPPPVPVPPPAPAPLFSLNFQRPIPAGRIVSFQAPVAIPVGRYSVTRQSAAPAGVPEAAAVIIGG